jgi:hypothetical protein
MPGEDDGACDVWCRRSRSNPDFSKQSRESWVGTQVIQTGTATQGCAQGFDGEAEAGMERQRQMKIFRDVDFDIALRKGVNEK